MMKTETEIKTFTTIIESPVGPLLARAVGGMLVELGFLDRSRRVPVTGRDETLHAVAAQIGEYFDRKRTEFDIAIALHGPDFNRRVWNALLAIPYGATVSYGALAQTIGEPDAARSVGAANGANPIAIIVPCHRVIGADGSLVGYGGGLARKRMLLDLESGVVDLFSDPSVR